MMPTPPISTYMYLYIWICAWTIPIRTQLLPPPLLPPNLASTPQHVDIDNPSTSSTLLIDTFKSTTRNSLGVWHGPSPTLATEYGDGFVRLYPTDADENYNTQLSPTATCFDLQPYVESSQYLHVVFSGSVKFSISLNEHNAACRLGRSPFPATWDSIEAGRYARGDDIYVPLEHFGVNFSRTVSVSFGGFWSNESVTLFKVELTRSIPMGFPMPRKVEGGRVWLKCARRNSFAFGIDDGIPQLMGDVMKILEEEEILVTFFVVGAGLRDREANFSGVYREMLRRGHQIALHSNTHQKLEGLETVQEIDDEIIQNIQTLRVTLGIESRYFRPPYGTVGARTRQRLAAYIDDPQIINWSVDVEDWLWADSKTPERQRDAFFRDVGRGGNLVVMHYLSPTTVHYFREFIRFVKSMKLDIMRVDQCLEDPSSPPLRLAILP